MEKKWILQTSQTQVTLKVHERHSVYVYKEASI